MATTKNTNTKRRRTVKATTAPHHLRLVTGHEATVGATPIRAGRPLAGRHGANWKLLHDDCVDAMRNMPADSIDSIVCDPPYAISLLGADWDIFTAREFQGFCESWGAEAMRVLKPGGYLLAFSSPRTYHRLTCGLENAGFSIVDQLQWVTAQGVPKARSIGRELGHASKTARATALKPAHEPIVVAQKPREGSYVASVRAHGVGALRIDACRIGTVATGADAPGRWPANVLFGHGSDCRQLADVQVGCGAHWGKSRVSGYGMGIGNGRAEYDGVGERPGRETAARWECAPECPVVALDRQSLAATSSCEVGASRYFLTVADDSSSGHGPGTASVNPDALPLAEVLAGEQPSFRYCPKVKGPSERDAGLDALPAHSVQFQPGNCGSGQPRSPRADRRTVRRNTHNCLKPIALMRWLLRLVTPPGGVALDPFCGSGSTGCAVMVENADRDYAPGWSFIGIEREAEYVAIASARIAHWAASGHDGIADATAAQSA